MSQAHPDVVVFETSLRLLAEKSDKLRQALSAVLSGSDDLINGLLLCLVAGGHGLIEGPPGVGKTLAIKALSATLGLRLTRVQMTPDLMPSDLIGGSILVGSKDGTPSLQFKEGPLFTELLFADELNRANPRTQAALLEAMAERHVSIEGKTRPLGPPFYVFATQNPVELEGTFALPTAQSDRFLCRLLVTLPSADTLAQLLSYQPSAELQSLEMMVSKEELIEWPKITEQVIVPEHLLKRLIQVVLLTRPSNAPQNYAKKIMAGVSTRAAQDLVSAVKARAAMAGRPFARDEDLVKVAPWVLGHRLSLSWEARHLDGLSHQIVSELVELSARESL